MNAIAPTCSQIRRGGLFGVQRVKKPVVPRGAASGKAAGRVSIDRLFVL
jgi:hypothetical protein